MRTRPISVPEAVEVPDAVSLGTRGLLGTAGAAVGAWFASAGPANDTEVGETDNPRWHMPAGWGSEHPGLEVEQAKPGMADIHVKDGADAFVPRHVRGVPVGPIHNPDAPPSYDPWRPPSKGSPYEKDLWDEHGIGPLGFDEMNDTQVGRVSIGPLNGEIHHIPAVRLDPREQPGRSSDPFRHPMLVHSVSMQDGRPVIRLRTRWVSEELISTPRYRESKYGRLLVGMLNQMATVTWGAVSEMKDVAEGFAWNMYGTVNGRIVPAMMLEHRSLVGVYHGYLEGDYRLDVVGGIQDVTWSQVVQDRVIGMASKFETRVVTNIAGDIGYSAKRAGELAGKFRDTAVANSQRSSTTGASYVSSLLSEAHEWVSSFDTKRSSRVSNLFPGARLPKSLRASHVSASGKHRR